MSLLALSLTVVIASAAGGTLGTLIGLPLARWLIPDEPIDPETEHEAFFRPPGSREWPTDQDHD